MNIPAKKTKYRSDRMRSRLEARWAKVFDRLGIEYYYEPQAYEFDGVKYLPDFYLPDLDIFFEAKGVMTDYDKKKISALARGLKKDIVIGYPNGTFQLVNMNDPWESDDEEILNQLASPLGWVGKGSTILEKCGGCGRWRFLSFEGGYECRVCSYYDGGTLSWNELHYGNENLFEEYGIPYGGNKWN
jgi:hypothetical protein